MGAACGTGRVTVGVPTLMWMSTLPKWKDTAKSVMLTRAPPNSHLNIAHLAYEPRIVYAYRQAMSQTRQGMPKGPKGQKRPADVIGNAIRVAKIATGEEVEDFGADDGKDKAAQSLGRRGGNARASSLSRNRRIEIARKAAASRWKKR
jgi:hypothetical protein